MTKYEGLLHLIKKELNSNSEKIREAEFIVGTERIITKLLIDLSRATNYGTIITFKFNSGENRFESMISGEKNDKTYAIEFKSIISDILEIYGFKGHYNDDGSVTYEIVHPATRMEREVETIAYTHIPHMSSNITSVAQDTLPNYIGIIYMNDYNELTCTNNKLASNMDYFIKLEMKNMNNKYYIDIENTSEFILAAKMFKNGRVYLYVHMDSIDNMIIGNIEKKLGMRNNILGVLNPGEIGFNTVEEAQKALEENKYRCISEDDKYKLVDYAQNEDGRLTDSIKLKGIRLIDKARNKDVCLSKYSEALGEYRALLKSIQHVKPEFKNTSESVSVSGSIIKDRKDSQEIERKAITINNFDWLNTRFNKKG